MDHERSTTFEHDRLDTSKRIIRLFRVKAAHDDEPVRCDINQYELDDPDLPTYEALSYTWGSQQQQQQPICLNNRLFLVGENLYNFLVHFRRHELQISEKSRSNTSTPPSNRAASTEINAEALLNGAYTHPIDVLIDFEEDSDEPSISNTAVSTPDSSEPYIEIRLWVDQICINQAAVEERNHQVGLMSSIYSMASHVNVWIGLDDLSPDITDYDANDHYGIIYDLYLDAVLSHPYWSRLWIVQELLLAKSILLWVNKHVIHWRKFIRMTDGTWAKQLSPPRTKFLLDHALDRGWAGTETLQHTLLTFAASQCSDPRDKVFGLTAIIHQRHGLVVDYRKTVVDVYLEAVTAMLREESFVLAMTDSIDDFVRTYAELGEAMLSLYGVKSEDLQRGVLELIEADREGQEQASMENSIDVWLPMKFGQFLRCYEEASSPSI
jgi:hypothetical protein